MNTPTTPPANDVCPECRGSGQKPFTGAPYSWVCISCYGTGKAPSIEAKPPLASIEKGSSEPYTDNDRLNIIEEYLSDPGNEICPPTNPHPTWQCSHWEIESEDCVIDGKGPTLRDCIDDLGNRLCEQDERENK